jgi:hypothetical protein
MKKRTAFLLSLLFFAGIGSHGQTALFTFGYSFEQYENTAPIDLIVSDFNNHYSEPLFAPDNSLGSPGFSRGIILGCKVNNGWSSYGFDLHLHCFKSKGSGLDSLDAEYFRKVKISHDGFSFFYNLNLIHGEGFRAGPGFSFNMDQFFVKYKIGNGPYDKYLQAVDKFFLSGSVRFMLSFGKEDGFSFDLIPYYTLPFWNVNIAGYNNEINAGFANTYTKQQMTFDLTNMGLIVSLNFFLK